jgi:hypothetical protein
MTKRSPWTQVPSALKLGPSGQIEQLATPEWVEMSLAWILPGIQSYSSVSCCYSEVRGPILTQAVWPGLREPLPVVPCQLLVSCVHNVQQFKNN